MRFQNYLLFILLFLPLAVGAATAVDNCHPLLHQLTIQEMQKIGTMSPQQLRDLMASTSPTITHAVTWSGCLIIDQPLQIQAPVMVKPGTTLKFAAKTSIEVDDNGSVDAAGTAAKPIVFTATDATPGYWKGIQFLSRSRHNRLVHAKILYAGGGRMTGGPPYSSADDDPAGAAVEVSKGASLTLEDTLIAYSTGYGVRAPGVLHSFARNRIEHTRRPMYISISNAGKVDSASRFTDNKLNMVEVMGNQTLGTDAVWHDAAIPYYLRFFNSIAAGLVIRPGVTLVMGEGASLHVEEGGSLQAVGSADKPVTIRGFDKLPGYWAGIEVSSRNSHNELRYAHIDGGGSLDANGGKAMIAIVNGRLKIGDCVVENSASAGVLVNQQGFDSQAILDNNTYRNNHPDVKYLR